MFPSFASVGRVGYSSIELEMLSDGGENVPLNAPPIPEVGIEAEARV
jgi:hypothetical protein